MKIIDVWMQHPTERFINQPFFASLAKWTRQEFQPIPLETTLKIFEEDHIEKALLSAWSSPAGMLISNEEVLAITQKYPDRFYGLVAVDLKDPVEALRTLRKYIREHRFKGLRVVQWLWELPCTHPLYYPLFAECVELNVPVCLQVGLTGPLKSSETGRPSHIERIALDFPQLKIVCGHIGYPWQAEMIAYATKFPNVYIDSSAYKVTRYPRELIEYMKSNGKSKVMFGSNYPMIKPGDCLKEIDTLGLSSEVLEMVLYKNAEKVFAL